MQYCLENKSVPFSERTMLCILSECSASVRKSLQGMDYFAAEGTRVFDVISNLISDVDGTLRETVLQEVFKAAKLYLKGDFKVSNQGCIFNCRDIFAIPLFSFTVCKAYSDEFNLVRFEYDIVSV